MAARKSPATSRPLVPATVLRPITARLSRIQDLLIEVRLVLDLHLKQLGMVRRDVATLTESARRTAIATRRGRR